MTASELITSCPIDSCAWTNWIVKLPCHVRENHPDNYLVSDNNNLRTKSFRVNKNIHHVFIAGCQVFILKIICVKYHIKMTLVHPLSSRLVTPEIIYDIQCSNRVTYTNRPLNKAIILPHYDGIEYRIMIWKNVHKFAAISNAQLRIKCPKCNVTMTPPIYQCEYGHVNCAQCISNAPLTPDNNNKYMELHQSIGADLQRDGKKLMCAHCASTKCTNFAFMEDLVTRHLFSCKNQCDFVDNVWNIQKHEESCKHKC